MAVLRGADLCRARRPRGVRGRGLRDDEDIAERVEREHAAEFAARKAEVDAAIGAAED
jgi:hypothetical protein